jgi:putative Mg2+ transporter-C (MgtC) family protein
MDHLVDSALRIAAAVIVGAAIGSNRDMYGKPAGVRVHALVSLGAALATIVATQLGPDDGAAASRVIQGIIGGIGFLGAGVILRGGNREMRIYHVTTAATIWVTAALGIACGVGAWTIVVLAAIAVLIVLVVGLKIDRKLHGWLGEENETNVRSAQSFPEGKR